MTTYVTYFDINYFARGIVMIDSLRSVAPEADILVFALDHETETFLGRMYGDQIRILPPDYVALRWPDLERMRPHRKHWEYISMRKPCLMRSVLKEEMNPGELLFYVDSDTQFFSSPDPALALMGKASIGVSPHAFSEIHKSSAQFGEFNAGFLIIRSDDLGLTCMREWAADCFKWCYAKVEDGKFMNQGYLTRWPSRYPGIVSLTHPGLNLAPWNFDGRTLVKTGDELTINGEPLIFYHFHNMQRSDGVWRNASTLVDRDGHSNLFEYIYDPHSDLLASVEEKLAAMGMDVDALAKDKLSPAT